MKIALTLIAAVICSTAALAQNITDPAVQQSDTYSTSIRKIETDKQYTVLTFEHTAQSDDDWFSLNKEIYLQTDIDNKHYNYVKAEGIKLNPDKSVLKKTGEKATFKVYFDKVPANATYIDVIERAGRVNGISYFNYYNVSLEKTQPIVNDVVVSAPPAVDGASDSDSAAVMPFGNGAFDTQIQPMFTKMIKSMLDAQLDFYEEPGKFKQIAKLMKKYYDALTAEGFSSDAAIKIITADSLLPKAGGSGK